ncbi:MAG: hypothetical protein ACI9DC_002672 [Gammaproteobacteria bacterium]
MSSQPIDSAQTFAPSIDVRKDAQTPFSGYDYQGFRLSLTDVISAWGISGVFIALAFTLFG